MSSEDFKLYLDEKFKYLEMEMKLSLDLVRQELTAVKEQTTKTNGRVTELERLNKVNEENLLEYKIMKKYPKVTAALLILLIGISVLSGIKTIKDFMKPNIEYHEKVSEK